MQETVRSWTKETQMGNIYFYDRVAAPHCHTINFNRNINWSIKILIQRHARIDKIRINWYLTKYRPGLISLEPISWHRSLSIPPEKSLIHTPFDSASMKVDDVFKKLYHYVRHTLITYFIVKWSQLSCYLPENQNKIIEIV